MDATLVFRDGRCIGQIHDMQFEPPSLYHGRWNGDADATDRLVPREDFLYNEPSAWTAIVTLDDQPLRFLVVNLERGQIWLRLAEKDKSLASRVHQILESGRRGKYANVPRWLVDFENHSADWKVVFVFTDIVGSTELMLEAGDEEWSRILDRHFKRVNVLLRSHHGYEVDTAGDGLFCVFASVQFAFRFLLELRANSGDSRLRIRGGIH